MKKRDQSSQLNLTLTSKHEANDAVRAKEVCSRGGQVISLADRFAEQHRAYVVSQLKKMGF